jgi:hypothetical protein
MKSVIPWRVYRLSLMLVLVASLGTSAARGAPGDDITKFLTKVKQGLPVAVYRLDHSEPPRATPAIRLPDPRYLSPEDQWSVMNNCCASDSREALVKVLAVAPLSVQTSSSFQPDYCIVYTEPEESTKVLWIDSEPSREQMQLEVTGRPFPVDVSGIQVPTAAGGSVRAAFGLFKVAATKVSDGVETMLDYITEVASIDPKQTADVFKRNHWSVLGRVTLQRGTQESRDAYSAVQAAVWPIARPTHTAQAFQPRIAITAWVPDRSGKQYVLLMSYECRLAKLYVDGDLWGCCPLRDWTLPPKSQSGSASKSGLGLSVSTDQYLYKILEAAGHIARPKAASPTN